MFRNLINCNKTSKGRKKNLLYEISKLHATAKSFHYDIVIRFTLGATGRPSIIEFSYHIGKPTEGEWEQSSLNLTKRNVFFMLPVNQISLSRNHLPILQEYWDEVADISNKGPCKW